MDAAAHERFRGLLDEHELERLARPTAAAEGLPGRVYAEPAFYELERDTLFRTSWMAAAFVEDLPAPGDVFPVTIAGFELLFTHTSGGEIRCFHNVCRHRGMKLVQEPAHGARAVSCPWHCWTYGLDGQLTGHPRLGGPDVHEVPGFDAAGLGLSPVRCERWFNFLFVNIDGDAPPLASHMVPFERRIAAFDRAELSHAGETLSYDYASNWKLLIEGGIEDYHFPWIHPELMPQGEFSPETGGDCYVGISSRPSERGGVAKMIGKQLGPESQPLPTFSHFSDPDQVEMGVYMILPTAVVALNQDHAVTTLFVPEAHDRTRARRLFHFIGDEAATAPEYAEARSNVVAAWRRISEQDGEVLRVLQHSTRAREDAGLSTRFSPFWEEAVAHFQRGVVRRIGRATKRRAA